MVIDCHVHLFPAEAQADAAGWAQVQGEPRWAAMVAPRTGGQSLQGWAGPERLLRDMDAAGVDRAVLLGWYWENQATAALQNRFYADCVRRYPDRLEAFATVQAAAGAAEVGAELCRCREAGLTGLGELHPPAQGYGYDDRGFAAALELAAQWGWPVNLHVTEPAGRDYPGRAETPLGELVALAARHPAVRFIFAHWGGLLPFFELNRAVARPLTNACYDTAASPLLYRPEVFRLAVAAVGAERLLFGSDYPLRLYPRTDAEPGFGRFLEEVRRSGLTGGELDGLLGGNWLRLRAGGPLPRG